MIGRFVCQLASDSRLGRLHWSGCTEDLDLVGLSAWLGGSGWSVVPTLAIFKNGSDYSLSMSVTN